jgi:hypothetical protein
MEFVLCPAHKRGPVAPALADKGLKAERRLGRYQFAL